MSVCPTPAELGEPVLVYSAGRNTEIMELDVSVDGYTREQHTQEMEVSRYPVEEGALITDHAVRRPAKLKLQGWVTQQTRLAVTGSVAESDLALSSARPSLAWRSFLNLFDGQTLLHVGTLLRSYERMLPTKLEASLDQSTGVNLPFRVEMQEVLSPVSAAGRSVVNAATGPAAQRPTPTERGQVATTSEGTDVSMVKSPVANASFSVPDYA